VGELKEKQKAVCSISKGGRRLDKIGKKPRPIAMVNHILRIRVRSRGEKQKVNRRFEGSKVQIKRRTGRIMLGCSDRRKKKKKAKAERQKQRTGNRFKRHKKNKAGGGCKGNERGVTLDPRGVPISSPKKKQGGPSLCSVLVDGAKAPTQATRGVSQNKRKTRFWG